MLRSINIWIGASWYCQTSDASNLVQASVKANRPVIVVMNYRLGYLAYFASRELAHEFNSDPVNKMHGRTHDQDPAFGNWGLLDHKLAFEWIRDHIAAFGGDPSRVTSITTHMLTPSYHGLFSRDITHSGATGLTYASYAEHQHQDMFDHLCDVFWVDETRQKPENHGGLDYNSVELLHRAQALRDIPAEQLMQASELPENGGIFRMCLITSACSRIQKC